jgi:membrane-associated phospholipid phosphatase
MKKILRALPIEVFVVFLPIALFFLSTFIFYVRCTYLFISSVCGTRFLSGKLLTAIFSNSVLPYVITTVLFWLIIFLVLYFFLYKTDSILFKKITTRFRSMAVVSVAVFIFIVAMSCAVQVMFNTADKVQTVTVSNLLMNADKIVFSVYPSIWLNEVIHSNLLSVFIVRSYLSLIPLVFIVFVLVAFRNKYLFRKFVLAYFFAFVISVPFWLKFPAIAPDSMYRANIFHAEIQPEIQQAVSGTQFSPFMRSVFDRMEKYWVDREGDSTAITTFPSMHAAWGVVVTVIAIDLYSPLLLLFVPWLILELIGTVYTMQHYAVDVLFGVVVGFFALWFAKKILALEKKYFTDRYSLFAVIDFFVEEFDKFLLWIKK